MPWFFYALKRSDIFVEEVLELGFCEHRIDNTEDGVFVFFFQLGD